MAHKAGQVQVGSGGDCTLEPENYSLYSLVPLGSLQVERLGLLCVKKPSCGRVMYPVSSDAC